MTMFVVYAKVVTSHPSHATIEGVAELWKALEGSLLLEFLFELRFMLTVEFFCTQRSLSIYKLSRMSTHKLEM